MPGLTRLVERLCEASRAACVNAYEGLDWPETLPRDAWHFAPELISLHGIDAYERLDEQARMRLSFFEAVNFFSLNIHGERMLLEGLARRLYGPDGDRVTPYLHHFLDEENKHMVYFGTFCTRYAGKIYPDRKIAFPREYASGEEDFLFFARVLIFEEIVDVYNKRMADDARLHPIAREINRMHHADESRHLAFGRLFVRDLFDRHAPGWSVETVEGVRAHLSDFLHATWREYYNPSVYEDAGLTDPFELHRQAIASPAGGAHRERLTRPWITRFLDAGILLEAPSV